MSDEKQPNENLKNRLPREDKAIIVPYDDPPPLMEQAEAVLGRRMKTTRMGYTLDGKLCNIRDILKAAGLKYADE